MPNGASKRRDGTIFRCRNRGRRIDLGEEMQEWIWSFEDVTAERDADQRVQRALAEQELILDNATVGISFVKNRAYQRCNPRFEQMFGYGPGELIAGNTRHLLLRRRVPARRRLVRGDADRALGDRRTAVPGARTAAASGASWWARRSTPQIRAPARSGSTTTSPPSTPRANRWKPRATRSSAPSPSAPRSCRKPRRARNTSPTMTRSPVCLTAGCWRTGCARRSRSASAIASRPQCVHRPGPLQADQRLALGMRSATCSSRRSRSAWSSSYARATPSAASAATSSSSCCRR